MNAVVKTAEFAAPTSISTNDIILNRATFESMYTIARVMASGKCTVPKHLQGNEGDCFAVVMQAAQWGMNPFAVAQKTHVVSGTLGYEAQLVNAVISSSTAIHGRFHYEYGGDWKSDTDPAAWVRVGAIPRGESEIQWGEPLYPAKVTTKNSPLWKTNPKQQAAYLALKYWARLYCPAVVLGVYTPDELAEDKPERFMGPADIVEQPAGIAALQSVAAPAIDVDALVEQILSAPDMESLEALKAQAASLTGDDRKDAVAAYKQAKARLSAPPTGADAETGEIAPEGYGSSAQAEFFGADAKASQG